MAQIYLKLEIEGSRIKGESSVRLQGREDAIECASFVWGGQVPFDPASGERAGKPEHTPVEIEKRIDKSTPLLIKAFCNNEPVDLAEFMFFRTEKDGTEEKFYTVRLTGGHISRVTQISQERIVAGDQPPPMMEKVAFVFKEIEWKYEIDGGTYADSWAS
ncbi:MAG: type VI secretion system tube protein Hcp [Proteobacteria bacterium]|nr:type VI secretion system tube protein Hcp [Pseudomonadota bacterium]